MSLRLRLSRVRWADLRREHDGRLALLAVVALLVFAFMEVQHDRDRMAYCQRLVAAGYDRPADYCPTVADRWGTPLPNITSDGGEQLPIYRSGTRQDDPAGN